MTFDEAAALVQSGEVRPGGIGILKEKALHATLKLWLDSDTTHHEVVLPEGCVADIFDGERITEIQTGSFSTLRPKLQKLLEHYPVTVVYPLVHRKWLCWIDPQTGETTPPRRSPRVGSFTDGGRELIYLLPCLGHPRLTIRLMLIDMEEQRLADGWSRDGKRGSHRAERLPRMLVDTLTLADPADYRGLIPPALPAAFTAARFGQVARLQGRTLHGTLKVLLATGALRRERKEGNAWIYERTDIEEESIVR